MSVYSTASNFKLTARQPLSTNSPSQATSLRRRHTGNHREAPPQSHLAPNERETADAEAWERYDPVFGEFAEKVCTLSGLPAHVTEVIIGTLWRCSGEEAATS